MKLAEDFIDNSLILIHFLTFASADAIERAWQILDQIPERATGAYSHSQVTMSSLRNAESLSWCISHVDMWYQVCNVYALILTGNQGIA